MTPSLNRAWRTFWSGLLLLCALFLNLQTAHATIVTYPQPSGAATDPGYTVQIREGSGAWQNVWVYDAPSCAVARFSFSGPIEIKVGIGGATITKATVRPLSFSKFPPTGASTTTFSIGSPCNLSIEINGNISNPLFLYAMPLEVSPPTGGSSSVMYFGPGVHNVAATTFDRTNNPGINTLYVAGGAIVRLTGRFGIYGKTGFRVAGRGIIEQTTASNNAFWVRGCTNVDFEDVTVIGANEGWTNVILESSGTIDNWKVINPGNRGDGIDLVGCADFTVKNAFIFTKDDCISIKANTISTRNTSNIMVDNCTLWNGVWGSAFHIGSETNCVSMTGITVQNCKLIHVLHDGHTSPGEGAFSIDVGEEAAVSDVKILNNGIEDFTVNPNNHVVTFTVNAKTGTERGSINGVTVTNLSLGGSTAVDAVSRITGFDATHKVQNVAFTNWRLNGVDVLSLADGNVVTNAFISGITFAP